MKKKILSLLIVVCLVVSIFPVSAFAASAGTLDNPWTSGTGVKVYIDNGVLHVFGSGTMSDYTKTNQPWYSQRKSVTSIVIESEVQSIGAYAFYCCENVTNVSVKRDVSTNDKVLGFGTEAIYGQPTMSLTVSGAGKELNYDGNQPWVNLKPFLTSVTIEEGVKSIGDQAFAGCQFLQEITIPSTVNYIGKNCFANCNVLTTVNLKHDFADTLKIGTNPFPVSNTGFKIFMTITGTAAVPDYSSKDAQPWAEFRTYIRSLTVEGDVAGIGDNAFRDCTGLTSVTMYFNEVASDKQCTKNFGNNWLRVASTDDSNSLVTIKVVAVTADGTGDAFTGWEGSGFGNRTATETYYAYTFNGDTVVAKWQNSAASIKLTPDATTYSFGEHEMGYSSITPYVVTIKNNGNTATSKLLLELSGGNNDCFILSAKYLSSVAVGGTTTFSVVPKTGLGPNDYSTTVVISNENGDVLKTILVCFTASNAEFRAQRFVKRCYQQALGRTPSDDELADYVNKLLNKNMDAAHVAAAIFSSEEFRNRGLTDEAFLKAAYVALFNREADDTGLNGYLKNISNGKSRSWCFANMIDANEFKTMCNNHTLTAGSIKADDYDMSNTYNAAKAQVEAFAERLYTIILGRASDSVGKADWTNRLITKKVTGASAAAMFFSSQEYLAKGTTDAQFLDELYQCVLNRSIDAAGLTTYTGYLNSGKTRAWVFKQVSESPEFRALCASYGIESGSINWEGAYFGGKDSKGEVVPTVEASQAEAFIDKLFTAALNRNADATGLSQYKAMIIDKNMGGAQVAAYVFASEEFRNRKLSNEDFIEACYQALLGRTADSAGLATYLDYMNNGKTRAWVFTQIANSQDCKNYCATFGMTGGEVTATSYYMG